MMRAKIVTRPSSGHVWIGWIAEFKGLPAGSPENVLIGKGSTELRAVNDLIAQAGYKTARKAGMEWVAKK
jgi:hypothetical protein